MNVGGSVNAFTSISSSKVWLNIDNDDVPHFGLKIFVPGSILGGSESPPIFIVRAKFHISLKNSK
jgi:hypothetical protein